MKEQCTEYMSNSSHNKRRSTVLSKYGVDNVAKLVQIQNKRRATFDKHRPTLKIQSDLSDKDVNVIDGHSLSIYRLNKQIADEWLNRYHPRKAPKGNILCLGLVADDTIYCMMTFKKSRDPQYVAELSRMWTLPTYNVLDGYDILSKTATEFGLYNIVAYVYSSFENPKDYEAIGMSFVQFMQKTKWWIKGDQMMSDSSRRQKRIDPQLLLDQDWCIMYDDNKMMYEFT